MNKLEKGLWILTVGLTLSSNGLVGYGAYSKNKNFQNSALAVSGLGVVASVTAAGYTLRVEENLKREYELNSKEGDER